ncbi:MAG TPA: hypothetical protein VFK11_00685 [Candidatus Saccharimonadales bacterium]|nr:hypothetical protein [Candidatus Saccharimonadales bacterium]
MAGQAAIDMGAPSPETMAGQAEFESSPHLMGAFELPVNIAQGGLDLARSVLSAGKDLGSRAVDGVAGLTQRDYTDKFRSEFSERRQFVTEDGVALTARVLNPEFLENKEHAIVYSYSLLVPAKQGAEKPTVADIAKHGEETGRSVIAITTDGLAGPMGPKQLASLTDFWSMPKRRFEVLRQILPPDKRIIATGSSLGGMMSHALAATWKEEAEKTGHLLEVTHDIAVASAGHHGYGVLDYPNLVLQLGGEEAIEAVKYIADGDTLKEKIHRATEIISTTPLRPQQIGAVVLTGIGVLRSPLEDIESRIPHSTIVVDATFHADDVTHPKKRGGNWEKSGHPNATWRDEVGQHLALLTLGRRLTIEELEKIPVRLTPTDIPVAA